MSAPIDYNVRLFTNRGYGVDQLFSMPSILYSLPLLIPLPLSIAFTCLLEFELEFARHGIARTLLSHPCESYAIYIALKSVCLRTE